MKQYKKLKNKINELIEKINKLIRANTIISEVSEDIADALNCYISDDENEVLQKDIETFTENDDICNPKYLFAIKDLKEDKIVFSARGGAYKTLKNAKLGIDKLVLKSNG